MPSRSLVVAFVLAVSAAALAGDAPAPATPVAQRAGRTPARLVPSFFEANRGQAPEGWDFLVRCRGYHAFVRSGETTFSLDGRALTLRLEGAQPAQPDVAGLELTARANYLVGKDREKWHRGVPLSRGAVYRDAAPATTWTVGTKDRLFDFALEVPGDEEPRFRLTGAEAVRVGESGALSVSMPTGAATFTAPVAWQMDGRVRRAVDARYVVDGDGLVRVALGRRDAGRPTFVDPTVSWVSYLGGKDSEDWNECVSDPQGGIYLAGATYSADFPVTSGGYDQEKANDGSAYNRSDVFAVKLASDGQSLAWATYFGGASDENLRGAAVDSAGELLMGGTTWSSDIPTTYGVWVRNHSGTSGGFLVRLASAGDGLVWCTYGGAAVEKVALGPNGNPYFCDGVGIRKFASDATYQFWATRITPTGSIGAESTTLGSLVVDRFDEVCIVGTTTQSNMGYTAGTYQSSLKGRRDAFIAKLRSSGTIRWKTLIGGSKDDDAIGVDVDLDGRPVIVGTTVSSDFPVTSDAHQAARASTADGSQDAFLARLDADGVVLKYSTYFGGATSQESFRSVRWHPTGVVYVGGSATASDFPLKNAFDTSFGGGYEAIVMKWDRRFALSWSSFAGGSGSDLVQSLGMSADGTTTVAGVTYSSDLPVESAFQSSPASGQDAFFVTVPDSLQTSVPFPSITSSSLPDWTVGFAYSKSPNVSEGTSPYTWTKVSGTLPPGLALDASGVVSGTPTATGLYTFTLRVEDDYEISDERQVTLRINPVPTVATSSLPDWTTGVPFDHALAVTTATGAGGWSWKLLTGTLPPGLALGADGRITGTPTATAFRSFTVEVTDASGAKATKALTLKINPALAVENVDLPPWTEFRPLTHTFGATGGTGDLRWSLLSGTMTVFDGLASQTGTLQGTTLAAGTYEYVLQVKDEVGATATRSYASIVRPTPTVPWAELPPAAVGRPYTGTLAAADGTGPFRWTLTEGSLPPGLVLEESTGRITGTPTAARTAPLAVSLVDRAGAAASGAMLLRCAGSGGLAKKHSTSSVKVKAGGATGTTRFLELTEGCLLDVAVTGGGARGKGPTLRLLAPDGSAADLGTKLRTNSRGATLNRFAIPSTGRWFVAVDAAPGFKGTMRVALTISPPKSWTATLAADAEAPSPAVLRFSAPPGAKLVVTLTPVSGGSARPVLADVLGPDEASLLATGTLGGTAPTVTFSTAAALVGGDHRVLVSAEPGFAGDVVCTVKLKLPRTYTFSLPDLPAGEDDEE